ncbi:MAG: hypothetical protein CMN77_15220 [Spirochaetaceae bacterium]|nr:hypothetical protein [Spirochaetaceae bacterium]|tara:strand:- start:188799 stop:190634 length:1836 start_codon:yes stop_codon:yes gene_type:complete
MDEMEFDRTRKAIGAQNLGAQDRKKMLDQLKGSGGQVLGERAVRKEEPERERSRGRSSGGSGEGTRMPSEIARENRKKELEAQARLRKELEAEEKAASGFFARVGIKMRCMFMGLTPYGQDMVKPSFFSLINLEGKRALMECNILGNELLFSEPAVSKEVRKELSRSGPLYVEVLERASKLYDRKELSELLSDYQDYPDRSVPLDAIRPSLFALLRKLYYLRPYSEAFQVAAELAIGTQQKVQKKATSLYDSKRKKIRADWRTLMEQVYPALVALAQRAEMKKAEPGTRLFENMIGVVESDKLGKITGSSSEVQEANRQTSQKQAPEEESKEASSEKADNAELAEDEALDASELNSGEAEENQEEQAAESDEPESQGQKELQYGMQVMSSFPIDELRKRYDPKGEWKLVPYQDKVVIAYLFLRLFEDEFSVVLTTPQIKLHTAYRGGVKIDYRERMSDCLEKIRQPYDYFKTYIHECLEFHRAARDSAQAGNYVEHAKKVSFHDSRRGQSGRQTRIQIKDFMDEVNTILTEIIEDFRAGGSTLSNGEDSLQFDLKPNEGMRLDGKKVKEALMETSCFAKALAHRLESGDLYGGVIEMNTEDYQKSFGALPS